MLKKAKVEILRNGKWEILEKETDYKSISRLFLLMATVSLVGAVGYWVQKHFANRLTADTKNSDKNIQTVSAKKKLIGVFRTDGKSLVVDNQGNLYSIIEKDLALTAKKTLKLNVSETIAAVSPTGGENVVVVNNEENGTLVKFLVVDAHGKLAEEKVIYNTRLQDRDFVSTVFITEKEEIIWRKSPGDYLVLKSPLQQEAVADMVVYKDAIYLIGEKDSLYIFKSPENNNTESQWQKLADGNQDKEKDGTMPFFVQVFDHRLVIIGNDQSLEEYSLKNNRAALKTVNSFESIKQKKPSYLANFKIVSLTSVGLPESWCLINPQYIKCSKLKSDYRVFGIGSNVIVGKDDSFWVLP